MEQFHLHKLFQELSSKLVCPYCKKKIHIQGLELQHSSGNMCSFNAKCQQCDNILNISAVVETKTTPVGDILNESSRIQNESLKHTPISNQEIDAIKQKLQQGSTVYSLFDIEDTKDNKFHF